MNRHPCDIEPFGTSARRIGIGGRVQGVGFRPFVYRTAHALGLSGWVRNGPGRVLIHIEGRPQEIARFEAALIADAPPLARPVLEDSAMAPVEHATDFRILASEVAEEPDVHLPPDLFCCDACLAELRDPSEGRFGYAFTNCTQCGPRYTIIEALPYDRSNTSMAGFTLCARCRGEYDNPLDRRFHAQPLACPDCGPQLAFCRNGATLERDAALAEALALLRAGGIVALKGVGGYHLMCDAADNAAVERLRARKRRPHKPLAVMFPQEGADGLDAVRAAVLIDDAEAKACADPTRPIVLARRRRDCRLSQHLAPALAELGVFLPYSPLHHLLLARFGAPLVATSGNISGEPVITDNVEAEHRLAGVADAFLHHDRKIVRPADDSVVRVIGGRARPIRVGRGLAPLEIALGDGIVEPTLAVGGHMKGAIALGWGRRAVVSSHIGELDSPRGLAIFAQVIADLQALYHVGARRIVCDAHPGYASTRWAMAQGLPVTRVAHHVAHASALAGEHPTIARWLVFTWDGIGLGTDGDLWGGEALLGAPGAWRRVASFRPFHLTGGDRAGREPWRSAAALMWETGRAWAPPIEDGALAEQAWRKRIGTARTSSVGRLFDAAASLVLDIHTATFEGQAPMMLESTARDGAAIPLPLGRDRMGILRTDWEPLLPMLADDRIPAPIRAGMFHESLAQSLADQAAALAREVHIDAIGLTGGVFQNRRLAKRATALLARLGLSVHLPETVPANDGGLAFGQLIESMARIAS
jgi:hydrogenase maturation protein HypF